MDEVAYKPRKIDLDWSRELLRVCKDGATWVLPGNGDKFVVSHERKSVTRVAGHASDLPVFRAVFEELGYAVYDTVPRGKVKKKTMR